MNSKIIAILIVFISACLVAYLAYSSGYVAQNYMGALARVEGLDPENYREESAADLVVRYISMGHYANAIIDTANDAIYRICNALLIACLVIIFLSVALAIFIIKNSNRYSQQDVANDATPCCKR